MTKTTTSLPKHVVLENGQQMPATIREIRALLKEEAGVDVNGASIGHVGPEGPAWLTVEQAKWMRQTGRCPLCSEAQEVAEVGYKGADADGVGCTWTIDEVIL